MHCTQKNECLQKPHFKIVKNSFLILRKFVNNGILNTSLANVALCLSMRKCLCMFNPTWGMTFTLSSLFKNVPSISWQKLCRTHQIYTILGNLRTSIIVDFKIRHLPLNNPNAFSSTIRPFFIWAYNLILLVLPSRKDSTQSSGSF